MIKADFLILKINEKNRMKLRTIETKALWRDIMEDNGQKSVKYRVVERESKVKIHLKIHSYSSLLFFVIIFLYQFLFI